MKKELSSILVLALGSLVLLYPLAAIPEIFQVSEAREGVVVQEMLQSGEFILPLRHGEVVPSKPIFFHWLSAGLWELSGFDPELALRSTSLLAAVLILVCCFLLLKDILGAKLAGFCCFVLLTSYGFVRLATDGRVDMLFNFYLVSALLVWFRLSFEKKLASEIPRSAIHIISILIGFAVLAKGPLGLVLPILIISADIIFRLGGWRQLRALINWGWLWCPLIFAPWYLLAFKEQGEDFLGRHLLFENIARFFGNSDITHKPPWFYLEHIWSQFFPWSLVVLVLLFIFSRRKRLRNRIAFSPEQLSAIKFSLIWIVGTLVFLSLASGKRRAYLLTILPALSIVAGIYIEVSYQLIRKRLLAIANIEFAFKVLWSIVVVFLLLVINGDLFRNEKYLFLINEVANEHKYLFYLSSIVGLLSASYFLVRKPGKENSIALSCILFPLVLVFSIYPMAMAYKGKTHSYKVFAENLRKTVPAGVEISFIKTAKKESYESLFYYYKKRIRLFHPEKPLEGKGYFIATKAYLEENSVAFIDEILTGGRLTDQADEQLVLFKLQ